MEGNSKIKLLRICSMGALSAFTYHQLNEKKKENASNYIRNMSNYENDGHWNEIWDAMFYKFLTDNKSKLKGGAAFYLRNLFHFEKKSSKDKKEIFKKIKI